MEIIQAIILGIVQGITEFLPISSSAHLTIIPKFLDWEEQSLLFDISLHFGTVIAIIVFFRKRLQEIIKSFLTGKGSESNYSLVNIFLTTIPALIFYAIFKEDINTIFKSTQTIIITLALGGFLLLVLDISTRNTKLHEKVNASKALAFGLAQALSLIRGVSRSGSIITVGLFLGINRKLIAEYAFIASLPIILGGLLLEISDYISSPNKEALLPIFVGLTVSAIVGYFALFVLFKFLDKHSLTIIGIYRMLLAGIIYLTLL